jgi:predicted nucleic acid-binding protein
LDNEIEAICLDTGILSNFLKGKEAALQLMEKYKDQDFELYTTSINIAEYYNGLFKVKGNAISGKKIKELNDLFKTLHPRSLDYEAAYLAGKLFGTILKGREIGWRDTFIAAIVLLNGKMIITSNIEHFQRIPDLNTIKYY